MPSPTSAETLPEPCFDHLRRMTDRRGVWEHALFTTPRTEHGYCTDDNARALIVMCRTPTPSPDLARIYLNFVREAQLTEGGFHNRRSAAGLWTDAIGSDDSQGRAIWAAGVASRLGPEPWMRDLGLEIFDNQQQFASPSPRANAFALLGAAEVLTTSHDNVGARRLLEQCASHIRVPDDARWPWPEVRLAYDNARLPEALLAAGPLLADGELIDTGLRLLEWLVDVETTDGHFSFTPVRGWEPGEPRPGFDQQPVEAAAMADACFRAWVLTGDAQWRTLVERAARWFVGANDADLSIYDPQTGGCGDGLGPDHINQNRGAESTLAALSALERADRVRRLDGSVAPGSGASDPGRLSFGFAF